MSELWPIFIVSMVLMALSERNSIIRVDRFGRREYIRREWFFYGIMMVVMAVFVGLRKGYNDTYTYRQGYEAINTARHFWGGINWKLSGSVGFEISQRILKYAGFSAQSFIMFFSLVDVGISLWFLGKYSKYRSLSVFFYFAMGCYTFNMAAIMQCTAAALSLVATDRAMQRKWGSFLIWILLAVSFHTYSVMYILVPILMFNPWTKKTYWMVAIFLVAGLALESMIGVIVDITTMMGEGYTVESFTEAGVNIFRMLVVWVPVVLSFFARKLMAENNDRTTNVMMNLAMLNAEIMFVALFGTANYFARLANYFLVFQAISLPWLFEFYNERSKRLLIIGSIACYFAYFYYSNAILYGGFDALFSKVRLWDYVVSLF